MKVERHWWNGSLSPRARRDVFIRSDGEQWEVMARAGGVEGRTRTHHCPGRATAEILASAWRGNGGDWQEMPSDEPEELSRATFWPSSRSMT